MNGGKQPDKKGREFARPGVKDIGVSAFSFTFTFLNWALSMQFFPG